MELLPLGVCAPLLHQEEFPGVLEVVVAFDVILGVNKCNDRRDGIWGESSRSVEAGGGGGSSAGSCVVGFNGSVSSCQVTLLTSA